MIDKRDGREPSSASADSFSPLFARIAPPSGPPVTAVLAYGIIYMEDVCAHVGARSPTHVSFMELRSRARRRFRVSLDFERAELFRVIILIYSMSKYPASSWVRRMNDVHYLLRFRSRKELYPMKVLVSVRSSLHSLPFTPGWKTLISPFRSFYRSRS